MAHCKNCGAQFPDGSRFCNSCGTPITEETYKPLPAVSEPKATPAAETVSATTVMVLGIVGLALGALGSTVVFGIAGIIVSIMALKKADIYLSEHGALSGQAKVGHTLASIGKIVGIVTTVIGAVAVVMITLLYAFYFVLWLLAVFSYSYY